MTWHLKMCVPQIRLFFFCINLLFLPWVCCAWYSVTYSWVCAWCVINQSMVTISPLLGHTGTCSRHRLKSGRLYSAPVHVRRKVHKHPRSTYILTHAPYINTDLHWCKLTHTRTRTHTQTHSRSLPAFSKTSPWTDASASAAINHVDVGAEGKAHLVHVAPTPRLNKP